MIFGAEMTTCGSLAASRSRVATATSRTRRITQRACFWKLLLADVLSDFAHPQVVRRTNGKPTQIIARPGHERELRAADLETCDLLRDEAEVVRFFGGAACRSFNDGGGDRCDDRIVCGDRSIITGPEHLVRASARASGNIARAPIAADGHRANACIGIDRRACAIVSGKDLRVIDRAADCEAGNR